MGDVFLGVDIGTGSTKAVLVDRDGQVLAKAERPHETSTPQPGWFEHDASLWWSDFTAVTREVIASRPPPSAVAVSGIGPCFLPATELGEPLRPAILYGIDTRATSEVEELTGRLGAEAILARGGSALSSQATGPKMLWVRRHEPELWRSTRRFFMASSFLVHRLTGVYQLDHHSASQCDPLYDLDALSWNREWADEIAPGLVLPDLAWPGELVGVITPQAAAATGLRAGTPVAAGTVDAWSEALSVGAAEPGRTMLMYGTTLFLILSTETPIRHPNLWGTVGVERGRWSLAAGLSTGGAVATWFGRLAGVEMEKLFAEAAGARPGDVLVLPYFAGERTPISDPGARAVIAGLRLDHARANVFRALLEGTGLAVRHNLEAMRDAGVRPERLIAVGGGTRSDLWLQIVSDVTGVIQEVPEVTIGAAYGDGMLAAMASGATSSELHWNRVARTVSPDSDQTELWAMRYDQYRDLYKSTRDIVHQL